MRGARTLALLLCLAASGSTASVSAPPAGDPARRPGGDTTSARRRPGLRPAPNVPRDERPALAVGRSFFSTPWVRAPASTTARDGLGPLFNARACTGCHPGGGRARLAPGATSAPVGLVFRLGIPRSGTSAAAPDPTYGAQLQTSGRAPAANPARTRAVGGEGRARLRWYGDPPRPVPVVESPSYGPVHGDTRISARLAPAIHGVGLLDAIEDADLLAREDPEDADRDGISGRARRVPDLTSGTIRLGRFGHKARHPTVRQQIAAAFRDDIGITSVLFPRESCSARQPACLRAPGGNGPDSPYEIRTDLLDAVVEFARRLAVPARGPESKATRRGGAVFGRVGCAGCHTPSYRTGVWAQPASLAGQTIWPYTDLLLHDMGPGLADGVAEADAAPPEWRTAPLWGLGAVPTEERSLLHDGRARSIDEAVRWHGGEAKASRERFRSLSREDRDALLQFLDSL